MESFIEKYDNVLSADTCQTLIDQFETIGSIEGQFYNKGSVFTDHSVKKCKQLENTNLNDPTLISNIIRPVLCNCLDEYAKKYVGLHKHVGLWTYTGDFAFQAYYDETDGYKGWHCEHGAGFPSANRILAWMFYLNDAESGTEFQYFPTMKAKAGRCVIWPAGWTHFHRSEPNKGLKYLVTGWVQFYETP